jgi:hypothetical protein
MRITIQIDAIAEAFDVNPMAEVAAILDLAAIKLESMPVNSEQNLYDTNGNRCGFVAVS